jgi:transcriptional regulator with XRE-family HTH domain
MEPSRSRLRDFRMATGWTLEEAAALVGCSATYLSRLERDQRTATPAMKVQIARRLGAKVGDLFDVVPLDDVAVS